MPPGFRTNLYKASSRYIRELKIPVSNSTLKSSLEQNSYYPSLYSLCNVFDRFGIDNQAFEIESADLPKFQPPYIAYINTNGGGNDFVLVTKATDATIEYFPEKNRQGIVSKEDFQKKFRKIVFVAEGNNNSGEKEYDRMISQEKKQQRNKWALVGAGLLLVVLALSGIFYQPALPLVSTGVIAFAKATGLATTILLLIYEVDKTNNFVKSICSVGKQTNCEAVLNSKAAKLPGMSWSEAGFFYFASTGLFLMFPGLNIASKIPWLTITSLVAAPYVFFSIYYQWKVVKQWCLLCLCVQGVLLIEAGWAIGQIRSWNSLNTLFTLQTAATALFSAVLPVISWVAIKPVILKAIAAPGYEAAYKRLLYNPETFQHFLSQQRLVPGLEEAEQLGIVIGNPAAKNTIINVCNPYCGPCAKAHPELEAVLQNNSDLKLRVILPANGEETDRRMKPIRHLLAIASKNDIRLMQQAFHDWYSDEQKDYERFAAKYRVDTELKVYDTKIEAMKKWCNESGIKGTPTIFINGRELPDNYEISQLKHIL